VPPPSIASLAPVGLVNGNFRYQILGSHFGADSGGVCLAHAKLYYGITNSFSPVGLVGMTRWVIVCDPVAPSSWTDTMVTFDTPSFPSPVPDAPASLSQPFLVLSTNPNSPAQVFKSFSIAFPIPPSILATSVTYAPSITVHPPVLTVTTPYQGTCPATGSSVISPVGAAPGSAPGSVPVIPTPAMPAPPGTGAGSDAVSRRGAVRAQNLMVSASFPCVALVGSGFGVAEPLIIPSLHTWARLDSNGGIYLTAAQPRPLAASDVIFEMWNPYLNYNSIWYTSPDDSVELVVFNGPNVIQFTEQSDNWPVTVSQALTGPITLGYVMNRDNTLISAPFSFRPQF
jgi:hypothetical protein